jgi:hypothetical protein
VGHAVLTPSVSVDQQQRAERQQNGFVVVLTVLLLAIAAGLALGVDQEFAAAALLLICACGLALVRPVAGLFVLVFFTMLGDTVTAAWYPFTKNLSSRESILFVSDAISFNPLEIMLVATSAGWLFSRFGHAAPPIRRSPLLMPLVAFTGFVMLGLAYGLSQGGDTTVALWEARPLLYAPLLYLLVTNLVNSTSTYVSLFYTAIAGIVVQSLFALGYYNGLEADVRSEAESLLEHSAAIHMNVVIIVLLAVLLIPRCTVMTRLLMLAAAIPVTWAWVLSQRRAAAVGLGIGLVLLCAVLAWKSRRTAWWFIPFAAVAGAAYTAAFWNSTGAAGFGAQAVKSVIAPESLSAADRQSDLYRQIEAYDIWFTLRTYTPFGVGFGRPFLQPIRLPDISFYLFAAHIPHNSLLWIWMKTGYLGFVSLLYIFVRAIQRGTRAVRAVTDPRLVIIVFGALAYVIMYLVYTYVDIGWDVRSMVFLSVALAICTDVETLARGEAGDHR